MQPTHSYFKPLPNKKVIQYLLGETSKCFDNDKEGYKKNELLNLGRLLE